jgi:pentalenene oxygenase
VTSIATAPGKLPLLGHLVPLVRNPVEFLSSLPTHGDLVRIGLGPKIAVVVCNPELVQHVLRHDRVFDKGGPTSERVREAAGNGLATCPYSGHRRQRRLLQPAFHNIRIATYASVMSDQISTITDSWHDGQVLDMNAVMHTLTSTVTAATLFSYSVPDATLRQLIDDVEIILRRAMMPPLLDRLPTPGNRAYRSAKTHLRATLADVIASRRAEGADHGDLLSALLAARDDDGSGLTDTEIADQIITFFLGGTETTATALAWALYLVDRHPEVAERLHTEVDTVLAGRCAQHSDLPHLQLTGRIITETLRLRPPIWLIFRLATEDTELGGHRIAAGTTVAYSALLIHHRRDIHTDPERFNPDRWDSTATSQPSRGALIPFGGGPHKCIADTFAITEATLALATIAARWRLHTLPRQDVRPALSFSLHPRELRMRATARVGKHADTSGELPRGSRSPSA